MNKYPSVVVELIPTGVVGEHHIQVHMNEVPGSWPAAAQILLEAAKAAMNEAIKEAMKLAFEQGKGDSRIQITSELPRRIN